MGNAGSMLGNDFWVRSFLPFLEFPELVAYSTVSTLLRTNVFLRATKFRGLIVHLNEQIDVNLCKRFPNRGERLLEVTNKWRNQEYEPMYSCDTSRMLIILNVREYLWEPTYEVFPFSCVFSCEYPGCSFSKATFASMLAHSKFFEQRHLLPGLSRSATRNQVRRAYYDRLEVFKGWQEKRRVDAHVLAIADNTGFEARPSELLHPAGAETMDWLETRPHSHRHTKRPSSRPRPRTHCQDSRLHGHARQRHQRSPPRSPMAHPQSSAKRRC